MAETKNTFTLQYVIPDIDRPGLKRLVKEIKSISGLKPDKILDQELKTVKL